MLDYKDLESYLRIIKRIAPSTIRKRIGIIRIFEQYSSGQFGSSVESFLFENAQRVTTGHLNNYIKSLKDLEEYLVDRKNEPRFLKKLKYFPKKRLTIEPLTRSEKDLIYTYTGKKVRECNQKKSDYVLQVYKDFTLLLDMTGLRFYDAMSTKVENVYSDSIVIVQQKTGKVVKIPVESPLDIMLESRTRGKAPTDYLFTTTFGKPIIRHKYSEWLKEAGEDKGIKDYVHRCHPHNLRRSYATELRGSGVDISYIKDLMGHANISTTEGYLYSNERELRNSVKKLPLAQRYCSAIDQIRFVVDAIKSFHLDDDGRFTYSLVEANGELLFRLKAKEENIDD